MNRAKWARMTVAGAAATALTLTGMGPAAAGDGDSISVSMEPQVPGNNASFEVRATGTATKESGSIYVAMLLAPGAPTCPSTSRLAEATYYDQDDQRWGYWSENWIDESYDVGEVFGGRPTGKYRLCGYLYDTYRNPMATTQLDFTIGGTCDSATKRVGTKQKAAAKKAKSVKRAKKALRAAKAKDRPKKAIKRAAGKVKKAKAQKKRAQKQLRNAKSVKQKLC